MSKTLYILPLLVFALLAAVFYNRIGEDPSLIPSVLIDKPVPEFTLEPLPGREPGLASTDLVGEVSLVNVFGSWCIGCQVEHPLLMRIAQSGEVPIHGINWRDQEDAALEWLARTGDPFTRVGVDADSRVAVDFGVTGAPETYVVDANGVIRYKHVGPIMPEDWERTLLPLIRELRR